MSGWKPTPGVRVKKNGTVVGNRKGLNLIEGANVTLTVTDDAGSDEVDVTIAATSGGGGGGAIADPTDITGLALWLNAEDITGLVDGDPVTTWADSSAAGNDASQTTASAKPTYKTGILNSLPVVRFDGGDYLTCGTLVSHDDLTVFVVCNKTSGTGNRALFVTDKYGVYSSLSSSNHWGAFIGTGHIGVTPLDSRYTAARAVFHRPAQFGVCEIALDGTGPSVGGSAPTTRTGTAIGADPSGIQFHIGDIAEVIVYSRRLKPSEVVQVEEYLIDRYAL